jgi:predicted dehydrogenase
MKNKVNKKSPGVAIVGTGFIGPVHVEALQRLGIHITGILGSSPESSRKAAERLNLPRAYDSYEQILKDKEVDVVHITTPNHLHFPMARDALNAGKHVMCEKPLAMNSKESAELVRLAKKTKLVAGVNYNIRFYPLCIEAREMVKKRELGDVFSIHGGYVQDWLLKPTDYNWRVLAKYGNLRAIADIGTHWLDLILTITQLEVESVCADLNTVHPIRNRPKGEIATFTGKLSKGMKTEPVKITTEDTGAVLLRFKGGSHGMLWVSQVTAGRKNCLRFEIAGSKQSIAWNSETPNELWKGSRDQANQSLIRDPALLSEKARSFSNYPGGHNEGFPDSFKQCFRAFYDYLATGKSSEEPYFPTFADGHREIVLCEAILKSHQRKQWIKI